MIWAQAYSAYGGWPAFLCVFPGCQAVRSYEDRDSWFFLECPAESYSLYPFCPTHGALLKLEHRKKENLQPIKEKTYATAYESQESQGPEEEE